MMGSYQRFMIQQSLERAEVAERAAARAAGNHVTFIPRHDVLCMVRVSDGQGIRSFQSEEGARHWAESHGVSYTPLHELPIKVQRRLIKG